MVLLGASIILIVISSFFTYRFLFLQEDAAEIKENRINEINDLKTQIKTLTLEIDKLSKESKPFDIVASQREQFENELKEKENVLEQSKDLIHRLHILNLFVALFGFGVAVNYISKITSENEVTTDVYEIPREIYHRLEKVEFSNNLLSLVLFLVFIMQIVLLVKS